MTKSSLKSDKTYGELKFELDNVLNSLQTEDIDVDEALKLHKRGLELVDSLQEHIKNAENTVKEIKAKFSKE